MTPRFILAKYVPDLARMEPKNIGVFVWWKGVMRSKFLPESDASSIVNDLPVYQRWVNFWSRKTEGDEIAPTRGKPVSMKDEKCVDTLISTQKGNYILVDAGELLNKVKKSEIDDVVEYLFNDLVSTVESSPVKKEQSFSSQCSHALKNAGVKYKTKEPIVCTWKGVKRHLHPDYYVGNGTPDGILQRSSMSSEHSVNHAALTMDNLLEFGIVQDYQCRILFRMQDMTNEIAEEGLKLFEKMCEVVDVDADDATDRLAHFSS